MEAEAAGAHPTPVAGHPPPPKKRLALPTWNVPGYRFLRPLHRGGMGAVYAAKQELMDRDVAIKVLAPSLAHDEIYVARFEREAKACAQITHPNIVQVFDVGRFQDRPYLVMELIDGIDLERRIRMRPLLIMEVLSVGIALATGLEHAHKNAIVHRDIKPANVMIGRDGSVKLTDLGLAKRFDESEGSLTMDGTCMGSPSYMPPEQARDFKNAGPPADVYALGATLFHALYGRPPFQGDSPLEILQQVLHTPASFPPLTPESPSQPEGEVVTHGLVELLRGCLDKDPGKRYADASELLANLHLVNTGKEPRPARTRAAPPSIARKAAAAGPRRGSRRPRRAARPAASATPVIGMVAALVCMLAIGLGIGLGLRDDPPAPDTAAAEAAAESARVAAEEAERARLEAEAQAAEEARVRREREERVRSLRADIQDAAERGALADVEALIAELEALDPALSAGAVAAWKAMAREAHALTLDEAWSGTRPELYDAYWKGGAASMQAVLDGFESAEDGPLLAGDKTFVAALQGFADAGLAALAGRVGGPVSLQLRDGTEQTGVLQGSIAGELAFDSTTVAFAELAFDEQLRWAEPGFEPLRLRALHDARGTRTLVDPRADEALWDWVELCYEAEAARLIAGAFAATDRDTRWQLLAALEGYRDTDIFRAADIDSEVTRAQAWLIAEQARVDTPAPEPEPEPPAVVEEQPEPPAEPEKTVQERILHALELMLAGEVEALEEEGRFAVSYAFEDAAERADWTVQTPPGADRMERLRWDQPLPEELKELDAWETIAVKRDVLLFGKEWSRLQWRDLPLVAPLAVEAEMQSLDGHNFAVGLASGGRVLWAVEEFQLPPVDPGVRNMRWLEEFLETYLPHSEEAKHALVWERNFTYELLDEGDRKLADDARTVRLRTEVEGDETTVTLEDVRRSKAKTLAEDEIENLVRPRVMLGTFGSFVAYNKVRIEFGIDEAGLIQLERQLNIPR